MRWQTNFIQWRSPDADETFFVTAASAAPWLTESGLRGKWICKSKDTFELLSHPNIFAAGDVAAVVNHPRPKAGVFAVRQESPGQ